MGHKKVRIPIYELSHETMNMHLADQTRRTLTECLKDVDVEFQGHWIKTDLWIRDDSDTEDISLGRNAMQRLGFGLTDPSGQSIWIHRDPLQDDPRVTVFMNQPFGRRASPGACRKENLDPG